MWLLNERKMILNRGRTKILRKLINGCLEIIGIESRTSSPVRIPRDKDTLEHLEIKRLFPCGEGAGYAGGIVSAAMDGERVAVKIAQQIIHH